MGFLDQKTANGQKTAFNWAGLLMKQKEDFFSEESIAKYEKLQTLEDKTFYILAYLAKLWAEKPVFQDDDEEFRYSYIGMGMFRAALFLADAVGNAGLPYSSYPALIDPRENPYMAYLAKLEGWDDPYCSKWNAYDKKPEMFYYEFMAILHGSADPFDEDSWLYKERYTEEDLQETLEKAGYDIYEHKEIMLDPSCFEADDGLKQLQLKIMWLFGKKGG